MKKKRGTTDLCTDFAIAIMSAIDVVQEDRAAKGEVIRLDPLLNALVSVLAHQVAGIPVEDDRMWHFARIGQDLFDAIKGNVEHGAHADLYNAKELH